MTKPEVKTEAIFQNVVEEDALGYAEELAMLISILKGVLEGGIYRISLTDKVGESDETREPILAKEQRDEVRLMLMSALRQFHTHSVGPEIIQQLI
jgi:hypothetical protein